MEIDEFKDAVAKGLGRAVIAMRSGDVEASLGLMRRLVLRWQGHDAQLEEQRGEYIADLIDASPHGEALRSWLFHSLREGKGYWAHYSQRKSTALALARRGDEDAVEAIRTNLGRGSDPLFLTDELARVDGILALQRLMRFQDRVEGLEATYWLEEAAKKDGEEAVAGWIADTPEAAWMRPKEPKPMKREQGERVTFAEFKRAWSEKRRGAILPGANWNQTATDAELREAAVEMLTSDDNEWLWSLARHMKRHPKYLDIPVLLERATKCRDRRNPFIRALDEVGDPRIREVALDWLPDRTENALELLEINAESQDVPQILTALRRFVLSDEDAAHQVVLSLLKIAKSVGPTQGQPLLLWIYEHSPCSFCRESSVRDMLENGFAPGAVLRECVWDCVPAVRDMAANALSG